MSRRRDLSDEERALWTGFARTITPLRQPNQSAKSTVSAGQDVPLPAPRRTVASHPVLQDATSLPPPAPLGRRLKQRVARGREPIDARIDLHGMTQRQAHAALLRFLHRAQINGARTALVVTGKGSGARAQDPTVERGVLKRQVPLWLALPEFRSLIVGFEGAHANHGGQGALYVRLRRPR